jgi:hypothetical protein
MENVVRISREKTMISTKMMSGSVSRGEAPVEAVVAEVAGKEAVKIEAAEAVEVEVIDLGMVKVLVVW